MTNIDALPTVSASKQPDSTIEMQQLSDAFRSVLNIAEEAQSGSSSSNLTDLTDHSDDNFARNKVQWKDFFAFMDEKAKIYPKYLFRAHNHGHPFPRFLDDGTGQYSDSFGSDLHLWVEYDAQSPICVPIGDLTEYYTVENFFSELRFHLEKTQINGQEERAGKKPTLSSIVSLSGDFRWTAQRICSVGRKATKDQRPGLAVFETSLIDPSMVRVWRVKDMLDFLDTMLLKSSVVPSRLHDWAGNADEYVCWSFVPREALITFIPLPRLTEAPNYGGKAFLRNGFVYSNYLSDFRRQTPEQLSAEEYVKRASKFVRNIITDISSREVAEPLCMCMGGLMLDPRSWGYEVTVIWDDLDEGITSSIEKALETAFPVG